MGGRKFVQRVLGGQRTLLQAASRYGCASREPSLLCGNVEEAQSIFGRDYWPYGIKGNRRVLEIFFQELQLEGLVEKSLSVEQIFMSLER
jgi:hypothetical protein